MKRILSIIGFLIIHQSFPIYANDLSPYPHFHPPYKIHPDIRPLIHKFENYLDATQKKMRVPGAAVAIVYQNEIVFIKPYGVKKLGKADKINTETLFQLGSVSKPVAATLATILSQQRHFDMEDEVHKYLPHFSLHNSLIRSKKTKYARNFKIKNLLNHTSGVPRAGFNRLIESYMPYNQIINKLHSTPLRCPVGKCFDYHNVAFSLIGDVIQSSTQESFSSALSKHLLKPLNMRRTSTNYAALKADNNRSIPHIRNKRGVLSPCAEHSKSYYSVVPAGGINSTIQDMAIFLQAQMGKFPHVLSKTAASLMHEPLIPTPDIVNRVNHRHIDKASYGLGWRILNFHHEKLVFHAGWLKGYNNVIAFMPKYQVGIIILQNAETRFSWSSTAKFFEMFLNLPEENVKTFYKRSHKKIVKKFRKKFKPKIKPSTVIK